MSADRAAAGAVQTIWQAANEAATGELATLRAAARAFRSAPLRYHPAHLVHSKRQEQPIMRHIGQTVSFIRPDGQSVNGYLARPDLTDGAPAIIVVQEWWGLNNQIRGVADRLGRAGYYALVPDLYRGASTVEQEEAHHLMSKLNFGDAVAQDIRGAVQYLGTLSSRIGITGFCMGGALTLLSLNSIPELNAGVPFYGMPPLEAIDPANIKVPVLVHSAAQDAFFAAEDFDKLEEKLRAGGVDATFHRYLAHHAFANEEAIGDGRIAGTQYDAAWAQVAWDRTLTFFARHLWR